MMVKNVSIVQRTNSDRIGNIVAFGLVILVNYLANALPLGGKTTGEISDGFVSMFIPAGFTFAIWGLIYLALFGFVVQQARDSERNSQALAGVSFAFKLSCFANLGWIFSWHFDLLPLSMAFMLILLVSLIRTYLVLHSDGFVGGIGRWVLIYAPFSLYLGWITVATLANVSILQSANGWNDLLLPETTWTLIKFGIALSLAVWVGLERKDGVYVMVLSWAFYGISVAQASNSVVSTAALSLSILTLLFGLSRLYLRYQSIAKGHLDGKAG